MKAYKFKKKVEKLIYKIEDEIHKMPDKGLKCEDSQKVCLGVALNEFLFCVNGVNDSDFEENIND